MQRGTSLVLDRILTRNAEVEDAFRAEIIRGSILSLRMVGVLEIVVPLLMLAARLGVIPVRVTSWATATPNLLFVLLGAVTLLAGATAAGRQRARLLTALSVLVSVWIIVGSALWLADDVVWVEHHILGYIVLVMFGAGAAIPLRPLHTLALGLAIDASYVLALLFAGRRLIWFEQGYGPAQHFFTLLVTLLCTALTASVYQQRRIGYQAHQEALRTSERLREAEGRLVLSQSAVLTGRVAAALSHELNSPIGALASAFDTVVHAARRMAAETPQGQQKLQQVLDEAAVSGHESVQRLRSIIARMQRFTNLDRAEVQSADLNDLLTDVISLVAAGSTRGTTIRQDLQPLPRFQCRPQQMSAVFTNLVGNAVDAVDGQGHVTVATRNGSSGIEVRIEDNGKGISAEALRSLFDPAAFHVSAGRVAAGNWSLFSCRQIIREHGGEIDVQSEESKGTTVVVTLPV
jgi:signal transduction histidine kinase